MSSASESTALVSASSIVSTALSSNEVVLRQETIESVKELYAHGGGFCEHTHVGKRLEKLIVESFVEDAYDGKLHCLTLREGRGTAVGILFWREIERSEMGEWMSDSLVHQLQSATRSLEGTDPQQSFDMALGRPTEDVRDHWMKIELLCTHPAFYGRRIGTLLLAAALLHAMVHHSKHSILHVAGGASNVPATRLYKRFGFESLGSGEQQTGFHDPNRDMFVLRDISGAFRGKNWNDILGLDQPVASLAQIEGIKR
eukprot:c11604_g1_i1.p1 GENE.c11604_g1_i1~~c11604_g1_i1.p1  ORF type:complete len:257 (+),score=41.09 c11604_g1_i1:124-894(+)